MSQSQYKMRTLIGEIYIVASEKGVKGIYWDQQPPPLTRKPDGVLAKAVKQLEEYFRGERKTFDVPLDVSEGTAFQQKVWKALSTIPYGKTVSYQAIARKIKNDKAVRAVGSANGKNPVSIIVPCHRVIAADGTIGGYGGGLPAKRKLLELENAPPLK